MKLLLINPLDKNSSAFSNHFPPLGIAYIAALTPPEWKIELIDENMQEFVPKKADLVAISAMTVQINRVYEISSIYSRMNIPVVIGGIHPSMLPEEGLQYAASVVIGEAEGLWQKVTQDFVNGKLKRIYRNESQPSLRNMVHPRRDLFSDKYVFDSIQTSRGCPFSCDFCSVPIFNGRKYRTRPVDEVVEELKTIKKKFVFFVDDNIIGYGKNSEQRAEELFEAILRAGIKKHWISQASVNIAKNEHLMRLMKKTGCLGLLIGFESVDVNNLRKSGKLQNLKKDGEPREFYQDVISKIHKQGISVNGYFCFGYDDTAETISSSLEFILDSQIDIVNIPIIVPSPGTSLYEKMYDKIEYKDYPRDWRKYLGQLVYRPQKISKKDFYASYFRAMKQLYSLRQVARRIYNSLMWSKEPFLTLMILLFNFGYRKMREKGFSYLLTNDSDARAAFEDLKRTP